MLRGILGFFSVCFAITLFCSCNSNNKSVTCPGFSDTAYAAWFPYSNGQQILYSNGGSALDTITIAYAVASSSYTVTGSTASADSCTSSVVVYSGQKTDNDSSFKFLTQDFVMASGHDSVSLYFYSLAFTAGSATDTGLNIKNLSPTIHSQTYTNYSFQGKVYSKMQVITTNDTVVTNTHLPWIYKLYLSYGQGIVAYETFPSKSIWVMQ